MKKILISAVVSVALAALILLGLILPAEFDLDPLGTGQQFGLLGLSNPPDTAVSPEEKRFQTDEQVFELAPFESVELKYRLQQRGSLLYAFEATGETVYNLHAEPDGAPAGYAESFDQQRTQLANGLYRAEFDGLHGWFFENRGDVTITVRLTNSRVLF